MVDPQEDRPLSGTSRIGAPASDLVLEGKLADEAVRQVGALGIVAFAHDGESLVSDEIRQVGALACELGTDFSCVVTTGKEDEGRPSLFLIPVPHGRHELTMMIAQVFVEQVSRDVCGVHQMLSDREPGLIIAALGPKAPGQLG